MNPYRHRVLLVVIGASATALALFAFSGAWCLVVSSCGLEGEACDASFWEVFGLASGSMVGFLMIRPIRKHFEYRRSTVPPPPTHLEHQLPFTSGVDNTNCMCDPQPTVCTGGAKEGWRSLYDQMSPEEQKQFKAMMQNLCTRGEEAVEKSASAQEK